MKNNRNSDATTGLYRTYCSRGGTREHEGRFNEAISEYTKAIKTDPTNPEAYCLRADAKLKSNHFPEAITDYTTAIGIDPDLVVAYCHRGEAHLKNRNYDDAILDYETAKKMQPKVSEEINQDIMEAFMGRGNARMEKKEFKEAIKDFGYAIEMLKGNKELLEKCRLNCARARKGAGDIAGAISDYNAYLLSSPNDTAVLAELSDIQEVSGDSDSAIQSYTKIIENNKWGKNDVYIKRAAIYKKKGEYEKAINDLVNAVKNETSLVSKFGLDILDMFIAFGNEKLKAGDIKEAIKLYTKVIQVNAEPDHYYYERSQDYKTEDDVMKAIPKEKSIRDEVMQKVINAYKMRVDCWEKDKDFEGVIKDCSFILKSIGESYEMRKKRADAYMGLRRWMEAIGEYEEAIKLQPTCKNEVNPILVKAYINDALGNRENTYKIGRYQKAFDLDPKLAAGIKPKLAELYKSVGDSFAGGNPKEALAYYEKFIKLVPEHKETPEIEKVISYLKAKIRADGHHGGNELI